MILSIDFKSKNIFKYRELVVVTKNHEYSTEIILQNNSKYLRVLRSKLI